MLLLLLKLLGCAILPPFLVLVKFEKDDDDVDDDDDDDDDDGDKRLLKSFPYIENVLPEPV